MKEMTDRELTDKIRQVFENFEDPNAARGLQELRKKYPENNIKFLIFWWGAAAAVLLVVGGLWFSIPETIEGTGELAITRSDKQKEKANSDKQPENTIRNEAEARNHNPSPSDKSVYINETKSPKLADREGLIPSNSSLTNEPSISVIGSPVEMERRADLSAVTVQTTPVQNGTQDMPSIFLSEQANSLQTTNNTGINRDSLIDVTAKMLALAQPNSETDNHSHKIDRIPYSSRKTSAEKNTFSFYAGSYFNYSLGSETELNFGAGFTSDIKLTSNLKLSTGLALANNSLRYNDGVPSSSKQKLAFDALPSFGSATAGSVNNNLTTITSYDARLLGLDIPINLKYLIIPKDNKLYFLAGLSSGTYLAETYSLDYRNYSAVGTYVNQPQAIEVKKQLRSFDLARTLNISFGYSSNLGKTQNITIEPFLKYPLGGLGSEDLKFGATGINLKLNFSHFKKR